MTSFVLRTTASLCCACLIGSAAVAENVSEQPNDEIYSAAFSALVGTPLDPAQIAEPSGIEVASQTSEELFTFTLEGSLNPDLDLDHGVEISNVPVPASLLFLGTALGALAISRSRHGKIPARD